MRSRTSSIPGTAGRRVLIATAILGAVMVLPEPSGAAEGLTAFATTPSATKIALGQSVTDQAVATGNSAFGLPISMNVFPNVTTIAGGTMVAVTSGGFAGATTGAPVVGVGVPAGTTVTMHSAGSNSLTLSAAATATGTTTLTIGRFPVAFTVCEANSGTVCSGSPTPVATATSSLDTTAVTRTYVSASFQPPTAGTWCFTATFSGDPNYQASAEMQASHANECVTVIPRLATFTTSVSTARLALGGSVTDQATAAGDPAHGVPSSIVVISHLTTVNGSVTVSAASGGFPSVAPGAAVSGPGIAAGTVVVSIVDNSLMLNNAATASAAGTATLTFGRYPVKFTVCQVNSATTCATSTPTVVATASSHPGPASDSLTYASASFTPPAAGSWCFSASFTGDPSYADATESNPTSECVTVTIAATSTTTASTTTRTTTTPAPSHLQAQLIAVRPGRSKLGARLIKVETSANQIASVSLTLKRGRKTVGSHVTTGVRKGDRVTVLVVAPGLTKGRAVLQVVVTARGGRKGFTSSVTIPAAA